MKKLIVFTMLSAVLTGTAFAQLTFSGSAFAGIQIDMPYAGSAGDEEISLNHREEGAPTFNFIAVLNRPGHGVRLDTSFSMDTQDGSITINGLYTWANFLDNQLRFTAGRISSPAWVTNLDPGHVWYFDKISGFRLDYTTPIPGLRVGAAFRVEETDIETFVQRAIFGVTYFHPLFNAVFAYNVGRNGRAILGFNYTGIPDLTSAGFQIRAINLVSWNDAGFGGEVEVQQKVGYRVIRPLNVSLLMGQTFFADSNRDIALLFTPAVSYRVSPQLLTGFSVEFRSTDYFRDSRFITLTPSLEFSLGGPALFYAEYQLVLGRYYSQSSHRFSIGIDIRAF